MRHMHVLVTLFLCLAASFEPEKEESTPKLLKKLRKRFKKNPLGLTMDTEDYQKYVLSAVQSQLPYHVFVFLTGNKKVCPKCHEIQDVFSDVSQAYALDEEVDDVFFVIVDVQSNQLVARSHNLKMIPFIAYIGQGTLTLDKNNMLPLKDDHIYALSGKALDATLLLKWTQSFSKKNHVQLYVSPQDKFKRTVLLISLILALVITFIIGLILVRRYSIVMVVVSFLIFFVCLAGTFYNIMEGIVWTGIDRDTGKTTLILPGMRGQYLAEGLICSLFQVLPALSIIASFRINGTGTGSKIIQMVLFAFFFICLHMVVALFKFKGGWYKDPSFFPPHGTASGPVRRDQGNTFWN